MDPTRSASRLADVAPALAIACALTLVWTLRGWADLSALRLPDPDDLMRLQQIRDWLAGQSFADLSQHRLGLRGTPMHWSRVADLVPAAIIWSLQDVLGRHVSEIIAVIVWPAMLFAAAIGLSGRIARVLLGAQGSGPAMIIAAIAFPATTVFVPGRIDHHGLQLVLLLVTVLTLIKEPSMLAGLVGGLASVLSLIVGMEMAPLLAVAAGLVIGEWVLRGNAARPRLAGLGIGLFVGTLLGSFIFRTFAWNYDACDGFTAISARAMMIGSSMPLALALMGHLRSAYVGSRNVRGILAVTCAIAVAAAVVAWAPQCLSPYGAVPPLLQRLWLSRVTEAQAMFAAPSSVALAYAGLMIAGLAASIWCVWRTPERGWIALLLLQISATAVTFVQLRGSYAGAELSAPALAAFVVACRRSGHVTRIAAWCVSAGMLYPIAAQAMTPAAPHAAKVSCTAPDLIHALGKLPTGMVMAPVDTAAPAISSTQQRLIAGAYHRDSSGDLAMYSFFLGSSDNAHAIALRSHVRWVVACDGFGGVAAPFASTLEHGQHPSWLKPIGRVDSGGRIFEVVG